MRLVSIARGVIGAPCRSGLVQADVRAVFVIVSQIFKTEPAEMAFIKRDDMIEHLAASTAHPSFCNSVLPGTRTLVRMGSMALACRKSKTSWPNLAS